MKKIPRKYRTFNGVKYKLLNPWAINRKLAIEEKLRIKSTYPNKKVKIIRTGRGGFWVYYSRGKEGKSF